MSSSPADFHTGSPHRQQRSTSARTRASWRFLMPDTAICCDHSAQTQSCKAAFMKTLPLRRNRRDFFGRHFKLCNIRRIDFCLQRIASSKMFPTALEVANRISRGNWPTLFRASPSWASRERCQIRLQPIDSENVSCCRPYPQSSCQDLAT